jgi:hypothetical protein
MTDQPDRSTSTGLRLVEPSVAGSAWKDVFRYVWAGALAGTLLEIVLSLMGSLDDPSSASSGMVGPSVLAFPLLGGLAAGVVAGLAAVRLVGAVWYRGRGDLTAAGAGPREAATRSATTAAVVVGDLLLFATAGVIEVVGEPSVTAQHVLRAILLGYGLSYGMVAAGLTLVLPWVRWTRQAAS